MKAANLVLMHEPRPFIYMKFFRGMQISPVAKCWPKLPKHTSRFRKPNHNVGDALGGDVLYICNLLGKKNFSGGAMTDTWQKKHSILV
jgi:hypothetical protein